MRLGLGGKAEYLTAGVYVKRAMNCCAEYGYWSNEHIKSSY